MRNDLPIVLLFLISIGFILYFSVSHIYSIRKLNEAANNISDIDSITFLDINDKKVMDNILRRIQHFESIEKDPIKHFSPLEIEEEKKSKKLRSLVESNVFENIALIDPIKTDYWYIMRWICHTSKLFTSNIILYPYAFNYTYEVKEKEGNKTKDIEFKQGAFIALNSSELVEYKNIGLKTNGTFSSKKARAVFDADIAILNIEYDRGSYKEEAFQDGIDWSAFFKYDYYGKGLTCGTYEEFLKLKKKDTTVTYATRINETEVINGNLLNDGIPRFGIFIIPDYQLGTDTIIKSKLGEKGINNIISFFDKGGKIMVTGKSGTLLEDFGLMNKGVYDRTKLLSINNADRKVKTEGCENTLGKIYSEGEDDFDKQMICSSINAEKKICLATTFKSVKADNSYTKLIDLDSTNELLVTTDINDGLTLNLTEEERKYNPLVLLKKNKKNGQIYVLNYNPLHLGGNKNIIVNIIALALSKDLYMSSKVNMNISNSMDIPIPAGEFGFQLSINTLIHNLNNKNMDKSKLYVFLPENFDWAEFPQNCEKNKYISDDIPSNVKMGKTFENKNDYLLCDLQTITSYEKRNIKITITVLNSEATQSRYQVLILEPILTFYDSNNQENVLFDHIKVNCEIAPLIRANINPDPSQKYPLEGSGLYFDNVLKIENKEESTAYDVQYYGIIPLISPIVDGGDLSKITWSIKLYADYYNRNNFEVPLNSTDSFDYIYPSELQGKGVIIGLEWDSPVFPTKEIYNKDEKDGLGELINIKGINLGLTTINSTSEVIKQLNYRKSDIFYKLASQRLMVFVDDSTPEGAKTLYGKNIPEDLLDPIYKDRAKRDFLFSRIDIYFYKNDNYHYPPGTSDKYILSIDNLKKYEKNKDNCTHNFGDAQSQKEEEGYFTNLEPDKKNIILKPDIWSNELFEYCDIEVIDPTDESQIKNYFGNNDNIKLVHYIIPNVDKNITYPGQLYGFKKINEYEGHHENYTLIKFKYLHSFTFILNSTLCKYGGKIVIDIDKYDINSIDDITVSPDHISIYKKEYNNHKINIYFKRGLMSNEQFGKDVIIIINIENLNSHNGEKFNFSLEEMKFDISYPPDYERYTEIYSEEKYFEYISVFSLPALEIKSTLNRNFNGYETLEPFNRYGLYLQELNHRAVYTGGETHHETKPGITSAAGCYDVISNLGTSSIPFLEYVRVGTGLLIPAGPTTSRVSWKDIWGRTWHQPLRSIFLDIPPIPPPVKNIMMSTTFELLKGDTQIYEWPSDENIKIHLHIKLLSDFPKYFEITRCKENRIRYTPFYSLEDHYREYENKSKENLTESELNGDNMFLREGGMASYGVCFENKNAYVSGNKVEGEILEKIGKAKLCADNTDPTLIRECVNELEDIKTIGRAPKSWDDEKWNYSPLVEKYYPNGYIESDMWKLTHVDYYDDPMDKAYKYHPDDLLPNIENDVNKPHNSIVIPLFKGLGYNIVYDKNTQMKYHNMTKKGWWGDNLQNKDDTLLAGQEVCNQISIDKKPKINWIDGTKLVGSKREGSQEAIEKIIERRQKNIYVCLFNRKRPQYTLKTDKKYYSSNVVENNVIPIIVDLDKNDKRLNNFICNVSQYNENNLYTFDGNYLQTPTLKDFYILQQI